MIEQAFSIHDYIKVQVEVAREIGWPIPSPFTFRFGPKKLPPNLRTTIAGCGIYFISNRTQVIYLGKYRPMNKCIIRDRWERHLQTITGRGISVGLGGNNDPEGRFAKYREAVDAPNLRQVVQAAYDHSRSDRFRNTGCSTTPNRLRFASENWTAFSAARGAEILDCFTFWFMRIQTPASQEIANTQVDTIETRVLADFRPVCNDEYKHGKHRDLRDRNTVPNITEAIRDAAIAVTSADITHRIFLGRLPTHQWLGDSVRDNC